jgi:hypothetical protein
MKGTPILAALLLAAVADGGAGAEVGWRYLCSADGAMPPPNAGKEQTACLVLDIDKDRVSDFVITERTQAPAVVWYKFNGRAADPKWARYVIEREPLHIEAGGDFADLDGDGDLDIVFSGDWKSDGVWWWENPCPDFQPETPWRRHTIKSGDGARQQHDCRLGDFDGDSRIELAWWSQSAKKLFLGRIPKDPRTAPSWPYAAIFSYSGKLGHEGLDVADINLDGKPDIVGAGLWFEHQGGDRFAAHPIADRPFTRTAVGQLVAGGRPEVVLSPGDADGPIDWYQWDGAAWVAHRLLDKVVHGHSLQVADIDGDGHLDVFSGEMGQPGAGPACQTRIFWGDGRGGFRAETIAVGKANHESRLADLDGDGRLDILGKPYSFQTPILHVWLQRRPAPFGNAQHATHLMALHKLSLDPSDASSCDVIGCADRSGRVACASNAGAVAQLPSTTGRGARGEGGAVKVRGLRPESL